MHITTTDQLIAILLEQANQLGKETQGDDEDVYDVLAATFRRLAQRLDKERNKIP